MISTPPTSHIFCKRATLFHRVR